MLLKVPTYKLASLWLLKIIHNEISIYYSQSRYNEFQGTKQKVRCIESSLHRNSLYQKHKSKKFV
jgi:hypothetical protein